MIVIDVLIAYLPAFIANAAPLALLSWRPLRDINTPIWPRGLGNHKTWVGLVGGTLLGALTGAVLAVGRFPFAPLADALYREPLGGLWIGGVLGFGALAGDIAKSFFKRRMHIPSGDPLPILDNVDYVLGALLFGLFFYVPDVPQALTLLLLGAVLSMGTNLFSYAIGLKKVWY